MNSINVPNQFTSRQKAEPRPFRQMPQIFGLAMVLIGLSSPLTSSADQPKVATPSGTDLVVVENPLSYLDGRPYPSYRLNAVDQGMFLEYGKGPNQCDSMNAREAMINCVDGTYYPRKENGRTFPAPLCEAFDRGAVEWLIWRFLPAEEEFGLFWQARQPLSSQPTTE